MNQEWVLVSFALVAVFSLVGGIFLGKFLFKKTRGFISESEFQEIKLEIGRKDQELLVRKEQLEKGAEEIRKLTTELNAYSMEKAVLEEQKTTLNHRFEEQKKNLEKMKDDFESLMKKMQDQMKSDFSLIANNLFEEKTDKFKKSSQENLNHILNPFKEQIEQFKKDVNEKYSNESKERFSLQSKIDELMNLNKTITEETKNLTTALKGDVKKQGNWGEFKLEKLLESSGLEKGREYVAQGKGQGLKSEDGSLEQPDFIVFLPENKHIIIDSKVSLLAYVQFVEAEADEARETAKALLFESVKSHIDNLSSKNYHQNEQLVSPEITFLFTPFEGALSLIIDMQVPRHNMTLMQYAWEKKIAIVTPLTLMATLKTIASIWRFVRQEANAVKIADAAGKIYDKFAGFVSDMEDVQKNLEKASQSHTEAFNKLKIGRGNLFNQFDHLKKLGAKVSKDIDKKYLDLSQPEDDV
jgi:DNA recombination protein RmuC